MCLVPVSSNLWLQFCCCKSFPVVSLNNCTYFAWSSKTCNRLFFRFVKLLKRQFSATSGEIVTWVQPISSKAFLLCTWDLTLVLWRRTFWSCVCVCVCVYVNINLLSTGCRKRCEVSYLSTSVASSAYAFHVWPTDWSKYQDKWQVS